MKARVETWGAWVRFGDDAPQAPVDLRGALVAIDHEGARTLGLDGGAAWLLPGVVGDPANGLGGARRPLEAHVAVTSRCAAGCTGCYQDATPHGADVARTSLEQTLDALAQEGVFTVAFGGGEPLVRDDLGELAEEVRARNMTPVVTTSGLGMTEARARSLRPFAQVNVSYDGAGADYASVRGFDGASHAERAIEMLTEAGVRVGVNVVLTRDTFPRLEETLERARALGAVEAQLLRYKPAGRAASLDYLARRLSREQALGFGATLRRLVTSLRQATPPLSLRIDCALVCFLSTDESLMSNAAQVERSGIFGCEAGGYLEAVRADGQRTPCSFAPATDEAALRAFVAEPPEPCASCTLRNVCRGGCRIVAGFAEGRGADVRPFALAPDPECPRVALHRGAS